MGGLRLVGVLVETALALVLVVAGLRAVTGRVRAARGWLLLWGSMPCRGDGWGLVVVGLGLAGWAATQAVDRVPMVFPLVALGVVLLGCAYVLVAVGRRDGF